MDISVVISNFNGARYLPKLLETLHSQQGVSTEIIVVDRNSSDNSKEILSEHKSVKVVSEDPRRGLVAGYVAGAKLATADQIFFCNEDIWLAPECLRELGSRIDLDKRIAAVDPWQWDYEGEALIHGYTRFSAVNWEINSAYPFSKYDFTASKDSDELTPFACAGAILIDRGVYEEIGGWDTSFFLDGEDVDLGIRLWQNNWKILSVPSAKVYHAVGASNSLSLSDGVGAKQQKVSALRYVSASSNNSVICFKYYTGSYLLLGFLIWLVRFGNNLFKFRTATLLSDLASLKDILLRFPEVLRFRRQNSKQNTVMPGQEFFRQAEFLR